MGNRKKRIAFIPVRGGSKSIPKKNIKIIAGKPLVYWVIEAALNSEIFDDIFISTDDLQISNILSRHLNSSRLTIFNRGPDTATDDATTESAMLEFAERVEFDIITLIQATSPLLSADDLKQAMSKFESNDNATSLLSVCRQERFIWEIGKEGFGEPSNYNLDSRPRRQDFNGFLVENGAFYITYKQAFLKSNNRISGNIICHEMAPESYYELDEPSDWPVIESMLKKKQVYNYLSHLKNIKVFLTDVDGVLTDAGMYYSEDGDELKKFNTKDGKGLEFLRKRGYIIGIITSEKTKIVERRAKKLQVNFLYQGVQNKGKLVDSICAEYDIKANQIAYIGDDVNDMSIMEKVGFRACPADAEEEVKLMVDQIMSKKGGEGCVRELVEIILDAKR